MTQSEYSIQDLYTQGRKNICDAVYEEQFTDEVKEFEPSSRADVCEFLNKLVILSPISAFEKDGKEHFRVLKIITHDGYDRVIVKNIEKLDILGINVYLDGNENYIIVVKGETFWDASCPPTVYDIIATVFQYMFPKKWIKIPERTWDSFDKAIEKLLRE